MSKKINFDKERYRALCQVSNVIPIFFQDWWLDLVCQDGDWAVMLYEEDPHIVAIMPLYIKKKGPFKYITMPLLTKFAGPYFLKTFAERKQHSILTKMAEAIPRYAGHEQTFHYEIQNWLPYKWMGFKQTAYYSYRLSNIRDLTSVLSSVSTDYRNNKFKRAEQLVTIKERLSEDQLLDVFRQPFIRQGSVLPVPEGFLKQFMKGVQSHGSGTSLYAVDHQGNVQAAIFLVWDMQATYLLLSGEFEQYRDTGVGIYTVWKGIEYASRHNPGLIFDFLGGMSENIERTRRQFGAKQSTYFYVWRKNFLFALLQKLFR